MVEAALNVSVAPVGRRGSVAPLSLALNARLRALAIRGPLASGLVVLVCSANVFSMALTRRLYRGAEIARRTALAATPTRIVSLLGAEGIKAAALGARVRWLSCGRH